MLSAEELKHQKRQQQTFDHGRRTRHLFKFYKISQTLMKRYNRAYLPSATVITINCGPIGKFTLEGAYKSTYHHAVTLDLADEGGGGQ